MTESQVQSTAEAYHALVMRYHDVCNEELRRLHGSQYQDAEDTPEPLILNDIQKSTLKPPMETAKRKEGILQQIIRNPDPDDVYSLSLSLSAFMNQSSAAVDGRNPVLRWIKENTNADTGHMNHVYGE